MEAFSPVAGSVIGSNPEIVTLAAGEGSCFDCCDLTPAPGGLEQPPGSDSGSGSVFDSTLRGWGSVVNCARSNFSDMMGARASPL